MGASGPLGVVEDALRVVKERPAIAIGAGVAILLAARLAGARAPSSDEAAPVDGSAPITPPAGGTFGLGYGPGMGGAGLYADGGSLDYTYAGDLPGPTTLPTNPLPDDPLPPMPSGPPIPVPITPSPIPVPAPPPPPIVPLPIVPTPPVPLPLPPVPSPTPTPPMPAPVPIPIPAPKPPAPAPAPTYPAGTYGLYRSGVNSGFRVFSVSGGKIVGVKVSPTTGFSAYCTRPARYVTAARFALSDGSVIQANTGFELVRLIGGSRSGAYVSTQSGRSSISPV